MEFVPVAPFAAVVALVALVDWLPSRYITANLVSCLSGRCINASSGVICLVGVSCFSGLVGLLPALCSCKVDVAAFPASVDLVLLACLLVLSGLGSVKTLVTLVALLVLVVAVVD